MILSCTKARNAKSNTTTGGAPVKMEINFILHFSGDMTFIKCVTCANALLSLDRLLMDFDFLVKDSFFSKQTLQLLYNLHPGWNLCRWYVKHSAKIYQLCQYRVFWIFYCCSGVSELIFERIHKTSQNAYTSRNSAFCCSIFGYQGVNVNWTWKHIKWNPAYDSNWCSSVH